MPDVLRSVGAAALAVAVGVAAAGCAGADTKLTYANFERIATDGSMTKADVDKLLGVEGGRLFHMGKETAKALDAVGKAFGQKARADANRLVFRWGTENRHVDCAIVNGKVVDASQRGL